MSSVGPRVRRMGDTTWHRPEYVGERESLIPMSEVAEIAEAPVPTVQYWPRSHARTWPKVVMSVTTTAGQERHYYDPAEIVAWLLEFRPRTKRGVEPARIERLLGDMDDRIENLESEIRHLVAVQRRMEQSLRASAVR
jgi:hypothetical protein